MKLVIGMLKEGMVKDQERDNYIITMMKEQITFLKNEIDGKNYLIKKLVSNRECACVCKHHNIIKNGVLK